MTLKKPDRETLNRFAIAYLIASMSCPWIRSHVFIQITEDDTNRRPDPIDHNQTIDLGPRPEAIDQPQPDNRTPRQ